MNKKIEEKITTKLGRTLMDIGEKSTRECWFYGMYEPRFSIDLLKSVTK